MTNFFDLSAEQHEAAAAALGNQAVTMLKTITAETFPGTLRDDLSTEDRMLWDMGRHERGLNEGMAIAARVAVREAVRHARQAERERERQAAVLMSHVTYGTGAPLTDAEIDRADAAHCRACSSIPCRCGGQ